MSWLEIAVYGGCAAYFALFVWAIARIWRQAGERERSRKRVRDHVAVQIFMEGKG